MTLVQKRDNKLILILALYTLTIFVYRDFGIPTIVGYVFLIGALCIEAYYRDLILTVDKLTAAFFFLCLFQVVQIGRVIAMGNTNQLMYIPALLLLSFFVFLSKTTKKNIEITITAWSIVSILLSIYVIAVATIPSIFYNVVSKVISDSSKEVVVELLNNGYGVAVGGNVIIIDYFVAFVFLYNIATLAVSRNNWSYKRFFIVVLSFFSILLVNRKTELLALIIATLYLLLSKTTIPSKIDRKKIIVFVGLLMVLFVFATAIFYMTGHLGRYGDFIEVILQNKGRTTKDDVSSGRIGLWLIAIDLFKSNPIFGIGWGNFTFHVPSDTQITYGIHNAHNCLLQVLCETGIVGFLIFYGLMCFILYHILRQSKELQKIQSSQKRAVNATCVAYQLFFFTALLIDPAIYSLIFWCLYALTIMISNSNMENDNSDDNIIGDRWDSMLKFDNEQRQSCVTGGYDE